MYHATADNYADTRGWVTQSLKLGAPVTACAVNYLFLRRTTPHAHVRGVMFQTVFVSSQASRKQFDTGLANLFPSSAPSPSLTTGWPQFFFWGGGRERKF